MEFLGVRVAAPRWSGWDDRDHFAIFHLDVHLGGFIMGWGVHVTLLGLRVGATWNPRCYAYQRAEPHYLMCEKRRWHFGKHHDYLSQQEW